MGLRDDSLSSEDTIGLLIWNDLLQLLVESELVGEASEQGEANHAWYILLYWFRFLPG